ncbi:unnamed protein product [Chrysoparadoxa australica]
MMDDDEAAFAPLPLSPLPPLPPFEPPLPRVDDPPMRGLRRRSISCSDGSRAKVRETVNTLLQWDGQGLLRQVNNYEFVKDLGSGSTANVKLCRNRSACDGDPQYVAVKVFYKSKIARQSRADAFARRRNRSEKLALGGVETVKREIAIMKKLSHAHVVRLLEVIADPAVDQLFVVMEYADAGQVMVWDPAACAYGSPITGGVLSSQLSATYIRDVLAGLMYLHTQSIVHRDLKPENILISASGVAKITDFGISHNFDEGEEAADKSKGTFMLRNPKGTELFFAPQMCLAPAKPGGGRPQPTNYDAAAADVWAAGVCLWVFLYGTPPFYHKDSYQVLEAIRSHQGPLSHPTRALDPVGGEANAVDEARDRLCDLINAMMCPDESERATVKEALAHPALSCADRERQGTLDVIEVSPEEIDTAIVAVIHFAMAAKISARLLQMLHRARERIAMRELAMQQKQHRGAELADAHGPSPQLQPLTSSRSTQAASDMKRPCRRKGPSSQRSMGLYSTMVGAAKEKRGLVAEASCTCM